MEDIEGDFLCLETLGKNLANNLNTADWTSLHDKDQMENPEETPRIHLQIIT